MATILRSEHPRPDRVRSCWQTLNGAWAFAFDPEKAGLHQQWYHRTEFPLAIQVPFCYQSELSGIHSQEHCDVVWYSREFALSEAFAGQRILLHFGAADYLTDVWLDGQYLGHHEGGYTPFSFDITDLVAASGDGVFRLSVRCEDTLECQQPRGKQSFHPEPFACWYTPVTGIWQSVWLEGVGDTYPVDVRLTPCIERASVRVEMKLNQLPKDGEIRLTVAFEGTPAARQTVAVTTDRRICTEIFLRHDDRLEGIHLWYPGLPALYDLKIETLCAGEVVDTLDTYFGMRKISIEDGNILLNNGILYQRLILDQGYWPDGLLTAPSDDALRRDVELTLQMGYNGARKHQKFEDPRYLYWADKLGLLVWGELPSAYCLCDEEKRNMMRDLAEAIRRDYNHPSLIAWVPLNESWGVPFIQSDPEAQALNDLLYQLVHTLDGTRYVSGNDGWEQAKTDVVTAHDYTARPDQLRPEYQDTASLLRGRTGSGKLLTAHGYEHSGKPMLLTEYGGIAMQKDEGGDNWGYNGAVRDEAAFLQRFEAITQAFKHMPGFSGYCYTQLTDVFQEVNGLLDMHRNPKVNLDEIRRINLSD